MRIQYIDKTFRPARLKVIEQANDIISDYQQRGFTLTLRQLYYQFVARGYIPNSQREYAKLGETISEARRAGLVDWEAIDDRGRTLRGLRVSGSVEAEVAALARGYHLDHWEGQAWRPEVWVEKDALIGVVAQACEPLDVDYFSSRGYNSDSEMWRAGYQRFRPYAEAGQRPIVIHLGDHDPSGVDMTRDNAERLALYARMEVAVERIALNSDQIRHFNPPPNPAKLTDSRAQGYIASYGSESWELDALDPQVIVDLITDVVVQLRNDTIHSAVLERERAIQQQIRELAPV